MGENFLLSEIRLRVGQHTADEKHKLSASRGIPPGLRDGLPSAMMLVGEQYDESSIHSAAFAFEQSKE